VFLFPTVSFLADELHRAGVDGTPLGGRRRWARR
jgi:hypothetical protein